MSAVHLLADDAWRASSGRRCLIIGEVPQAHDGSLGLAHAYVDAVADAGADAVKFQTHIAAAESTPADPWRVQFSRQDETRYDYWRRMEFAEDQWMGLRKHADDRGLYFLSSPFSVEAVQLLRRVGVAAWKVASGEVTSPRLLDALLQDGIPVILSSGMSTLDELDRAVAKVRDRDAPVAVLQCTSAYPCPPEDVGLNLIPEFEARYKCPVGLSDHSGTVFAGLAAVTLGASILEVHVTMSREMFGPDVPASVTTSGLEQLVRGVEFIERAAQSRVDKDGMAARVDDLRQLFTKSMVTLADLPAGTVLSREHLVAKKPGSGWPAEREDELLGRTLRTSVGADVLITEDHLAPKRA